jgi:hypothetical protein
MFEPLLDLLTRANVATVPLHEADLVASSGPDVWAREVTGLCPNPREFSQVCVHGVPIKQSSLSLSGVHTGVGTVLT